MESLAEDEALSGGPYILVALPERAEEQIPLNCTALVNEWTLHLDPISEMALQAKVVSSTRWEIGDHFVQADPSMIGLLREAASDGRIVEGFTVGTVTLRLEEFRGGPEGPVTGKLEQFLLTGAATMTREGPDGTVLDGHALSILLGLAVVCAFFTPVGAKGREVGRRLAEA